MRFDASLMAGQEKNAVQMADFLACLCETLAISNDSPSTTSTSHSELTPATTLGRTRVLTCDELLLATAQSSLQHGI